MNLLGNVQLGDSGTGTSVFTNTNTANITFGGQQLYVNNQQFAGVQMAGGGYQSNLWGPERDLDYWTARAAGLVPEPERRAMKLLASECDEERFSLYCHIGSIAALGNLTRHLYIVRRYCTVRETADGRDIQDWCVMTRDRHLIPETDHVLALKSVIEGEEYSFRATGNRVGWGTEGRHLPDPYRRSFLPESHPEGQNQEIEDWESLPKRIQDMKWQMWFRYHSQVERWKTRIEPPRQMSQQEFQLQELRNRLLEGVGAEPQTAYSF